MRLSREDDGKYLPQLNQPSDFMYNFTLYDLKHNYIGKTDAETAKDAIRIMIMHYLKYELPEREIALKEIGNETYLVTTATEKFFLKRKNLATGGL